MFFASSNVIKNGEIPLQERDEKVMPFSILADCKKVFRNVKGLN